MTEIDLIIKNAEELLTLSYRRIKDCRIDPLGCSEGISKNALQYPPFSVRQVIEQRIIEFE